MTSIDVASPGRGPAALADVVAAQLALLRAAILVRRRPAGALIRAACSGDGGLLPDAALHAVVRRAGVAIDRAARRGLFRPSCLVRSLALADLLARRGVPGDLIRVGVRRVDGTIDAHAWVECGGTIVGDDPRRVAAFTPIGSLAVLGRQ